MSLIKRASNDFVYLRDALRTLRLTKPIAKAPERTIREVVEDLSSRFGERVALTSDRETLSYRDLNERANRYARWARAQGIGKGSVVALMMSNRPEYLAIWIGIAKAGGATALINTNQTEAPLAHSLKVVGARWAIVEDVHWAAFDSGHVLLGEPLAVWSHGACEGLPRVDAAVDKLDGSNLEPAERVSLTINDRCVYVYTSGTTGLPKAANINHYRVLLAMLGFTGATGARASDRVYICLPMYHTNGGVLAPGSVLMVGGTAVIREKFSSREFWADIVRHRCTMFVYIGELCRYLVNSPRSPVEDQHQIRLCFGNGLRPDVWPEFRKRFRIPRILEFYAATEGNCSMFNFDATPGAVGRVPAWIERRFPIKVVRFDLRTEEPARTPDGRCVACGPNEIGEVIGKIVNDPERPANRFEGYADGAATEKKILRDVFEPGDAWFRTGDLMRKDRQGYYFFVDRIGDTFRWKGENVATSEVSEAITSFPGVREANVYGVPVPGLEGKAGMASLVVDDLAAIDLAGLHRHLAERLPDYARPVFLRFPHELDVTGTFKQRKLGLVAEGFNPAHTADPLFYAAHGATRFEPIDAPAYKAIVEGAIRL